MTWIFGYGSLIWRPGFPYRERRPALLEGYRRAFCRYSFRHRGTPKRPGLVVGLREGRACQGVAFAVTPKDEPEVLAYLDDREGGGYLRKCLPITLQNKENSRGNGPLRSDHARRVKAWSFIPNPEHPSYFGEEDDARLVELVATGHGESGSAYDYLCVLMEHLKDLRAEEPELAAVLEAARRYRAENGLEA